MNARTIQPLAAAGVAAVLTGATITAAGIHSTDVSTSLRTEFAAVQLQALVASATPAPAPAAAVTPSVVAATTTAVDPVQIVTDIVRGAVSFAAAALWYAAFPITLPLSVIGGLVVSVTQTLSGAQPSTATDPLLGVAFFFTAPNVLLSTGFANFGLSNNFNQQQMLHFPIGVAAATRAAAATKRASTVPAAAAASPRSAKKVAAADRSAPAASKRAAAARHAR